MVNRWSVFAFLLASAAPAAAQDVGEAEQPQPAASAAADETRAVPSSEEIVVTATRGERPLSEVPASIAVRNMDELERDGFTYGTDEFRGVTGVSFRRGEGDGDYFPFVAIRGSTGTDGFLTLVDGVPFVGLFEEPLLSDVPYDAVQRIEIVKGPMSALYGRGAIYGAVNYITRSPRSDSLTATLSVGSDGYFRANGRVSRRFGDRAGLLVSGTYEINEGWREQSRRKLFTLFAKGEVDIGERSNLSLMAHYIDRSFKIPNALPLDVSGEIPTDVIGRRPFLGYGDPRDRSKGFIGSARFEHRASDALTFTLVAQHRDYDRPDTFLNFYDAFGFDDSRDVMAINGFRNTTEQSVWFGEGTAALRLGRHAFLVGASYEDSRTREDNRWSGQNGFTPECGFTFFLVEIDYRTGEVLNRDHPCFVIDQPLTRSKIDQQFLGLFVQHEWTFADHLTLTLGGRFDSFRRKASFDLIPGASVGGTQRLKSSAFSPKAALSYRTGFGQVYLSYGRGFNSNFGAGFENDPAQYFRPELKPTTIDSYEFGARGELFDGVLRFDGAIYYTRQRNRRLTVTNPASEVDPTTPPNLLNFGSLYDVRGGEIALTIRPRLGTEFQINYSHIDPVWEDFILETFAGPVDLSGTTPRGVAKNVVYLAADQRLTSWLSARAVYEWYDDYAVTLDNGIEDGAYDLLTLSARVKPSAWRNVTLDLILTNAIDKRYYFYFGGRTNPTYAAPGPPRQFRATLRAEF